MQDNARTSQLSSDRVFVYLTQRPKSVKLFASRELSPAGVSKRLIPGGDPQAAKIARTIDELIRRARAAGTGGVAGIAQHADAAAKAAGAQGAVFLARTPCYSPRILVTL